MKKIILVTCLFLSAKTFAFNPSMLTLMVYKFAVSTSPYCTNLITVIDNGSTPSAVDFLGTPNIGSGQIPDGTYPCVAIEFSDIISYKSDTTSGNCSTATTYTADLCRTGNSCTSTLINGTTVTASNSTVSPGQRVTMYLSTVSTGSGQSFEAPTASNLTNGLTLGAALVVSGTSTGKFVVNATGKVVDQGGSCDMDAPVFSFSKI